MYCPRGRSECEGKCSCQCAGQGQCLLVNNGIITQTCKCSQCGKECKCQQPDK
jgi:hypothetical protein